MDDPVDHSKRNSLLDGVGCFVQQMNNCRVRYFIQCLFKQCQTLRVFALVSHRHLRPEDAQLFAKSAVLDIINFLSLFHLLLNLNELIRRLVQFLHLVGEPVAHENLCPILFLLQA